MADKTTESVEMALAGPQETSIPERIWTVGGNRGHFFTSKKNFAEVEYVRADVAASLSIEQALVELAEMFGDKRDYEIRLRNWGYPVLIRVATNAGLYMDFKGELLNEAMNQVRAWHAEQAKES